LALVVSFYSLDTQTYRHASVLVSRWWSFYSV